MTEELHIRIKAGFTYGELRKFAVAPDEKTAVADLIAFFDKVVEGGADVVPFGRENEVFTAIMTQVRAMGNRGNSTAGSGTTSGPDPAIPLPSL